MFSQLGTWNFAFNFDFFDFFVSRAGSGTGRGVPFFCVVSSRFSVSFPLWISGSLSSPSPDSTASSNVMA